MKIIIKGSTKEIADLIALLQGRQEKNFSQEEVQQELHDALLKANEIYYQEEIARRVTADSATHDKPTDTQA